MVNFALISGLPFSTFNKYACNGDGALADLDQRH
jgi:hypothetical protein